MTKTIRQFDAANGWTTRPTPLTKISGDHDTWRDHLANNGYLLSDDIGSRDDPLHFDVWEPCGDEQPVPGYLLEVSFAENSQLVHVPDEVSAIELLSRWLPVADRLAKAAKRERV